MAAAAATPLSGSATAGPLIAPAEGVPTVAESASKTGTTIDVDTIRMQKLLTAHPAAAAGMTNRRCRWLQRILLMCHAL